MNLIDALGALADQRCFIVYRLDAKPGTWKLEKVPTLAAGAKNGGGATNPANWMTASEALGCAQHLGYGTSAGQHGVGIVLHEALGLAAVDIDDCLQADGQWTPLAVKTCHRFPGAYVEKSLSGRGLHIMFRIRGPARPHSVKNVLLGIEAYDNLRFIAIGDTATSTGSMDQDCTAQYDQLLIEHFPPRPATDRNQEWTDKPAAAWSGPDDDAELIARALRSQSAASAFGGKVSFADLWNGNAAKLGAVWPSSKGDDWDRSSADQALFNHLCFFTGGDCERMARIALTCEALVRPKWDREDYFKGTILDACASHKGGYYQGGKQSGTAVVPVPPVPMGTTPVAPAPGVIVSPGHPDMPLDAARSFITAFYNASGLQEIHHWQDLFMVYAGGIYVETSGSALRSQAWKFFEHARGGTPLKSRQVVEILKALEGLTYLSEKTPVPCWLDDPKRELSDLIICQNGAFDLGTGERHDPTPRLFATIRLPVDYIPGAPPPVAWLQFLSSLWPNDAESIATLQEMFGLMLTPITKFQKIFLLIGPKRSGKGTILRTLRKLLGNDNVAGPALSTLSHQYGMQCLIGKLAALIGDARINARSSEMSIVVERLLSISGEDSPNVERKFLPDWTGGLPTRIVMSANELPHLDDPSGAMASRFVILVMQASFIGREDLELESKLSPEMPAILNWAIEGRRRLLERGRFVQPASGAASVEQMAELSSSVAKFIRECCTVGTGLQVLKDDLYRAWQTWCARNGERAAHSGLFGRDLHAACSSVKETRPRDPATGKQLPMYAGIKLADTYQPVAVAVRA